GAAQHEKSIRLDWHAATQSLNEGWDIEHSIDGVSWARIGWVQGDGNSSISKQYHFIHQYPKSGHNYYRIRQNDFEGNYVYSRMVMVNLENQAVVKIFPTLTTGIIYFEGNPEYIEEVKVFDPFRGFSYDAHRINHIDISDQPPGLYVVQILKAGKWTSTWVVKQ
ncbi:MAG: hypothetical protein IT262_15120, partial [Saprospiraceae bacterium]|nr:hypothetical protein [Saprospiraceae bacterium]